MTPAQEFACVGTVGQVSRSGPARILIIDDDLMIAHGMRRMLRGYAVDIETEPVHALERIVANEHFDVIVCDEKMPVLDGHVVRAAIRAHYAGRDDLPCVIMMSGGLDFAGFTDGEPVLLKPFSRTELSTLVKRLLDRRRAAP